jgi:hypothetical protein
LLAFFSFLHALLHSFFLPFFSPSLISEFLFWNWNQALVSHTYTPSNLEGWDQEDPGSRLAWANTLWDLAGK